MAWHKNNRAATTLWVTFFKLDQLQSVFKDSPNIKMSDLQFYNPTASPDLLDKEARVLADQTDKIFIIGRGAKYEEGFDKNTALVNLKTALLEKDRTMSELADLVDELYLFWDE